MQISLSDTGKRYNRDWIFRRLTLQFFSGTAYAITGPNGSGKSTLLQVVGGAVAASEGQVTYQMSGKEIEGDASFRYISIAAPYQELIEELTLTEFLQFHQRFKPFFSDKTIPEIIQIAGLQQAADKQIRYFSSGMKQRVKLAQAVFSDTACVLLDEPCTNLDEEGISLYRELMARYMQDRLVIVSSNDPQEYAFCREVINIMTFKQ